MAPSRQPRQKPSQSQFYLIPALVDFLALVDEHILIHAVKQYLCRPVQADLEDTLEISGRYRGAGFAKEGCEEGRLEGRDVCGYTSLS